MGVMFVLITSAGGGWSCGCRALSGFVLSILQAYVAHSGRPSIMLMIAEGLKGCVCVYQRAKRWRIFANFCFLCYYCIDPKLWMKCFVWLQLDTGRWKWCLLSWDVVVVKGRGELFLVGHNLFLCNTYSVWHTMRCLSSLESSTSSTAAIPRSHRWCCSILWGQGLGRVGWTNGWAKTGWS